jgi:sulfate adenylyltransferase
MIRPHGADALQPRIVSNETERAALKSEAEFLPSMLLNSAIAASRYAIPTLTAIRLLR